MNNILQSARIFTSYNGFVFPSTAETTHFRVTPVKSTDGRTILYNQYSIGLLFYIATTVGSTDFAVRECRRALSHQGGLFIHRGRGFGDIVVSSDNDLEHGPHCQVSEAEAMGTGLAVKLEWSIEFSLPHCGLFVESGIIELNLAAEHKISLAGYTTRKVTGFLRIANNRSRNLPNRSRYSADNYREDVIEPLRYGYRREYDAFRTSDDLSRLDFGWTDEEEASVLPPGVVRATLSDDISSTGNGLTRWQGTFNGTYELARGYTGLTAAEAFFTAVAQILNSRQAKLNGGNGQAGQQANPLGGVIVNEPVQPQLANVTTKSPIIPTGFRMTNPDYYGFPKAQFTMNYTFACSLSELLGVTEIYKPIPGDWKRWYASLADNALNPYGGAGLVWQPQDSKIVDSCTTADRTLTSGSKQNKNYAELRTQAALETMMVNSFGKPTEESSWLEYVNEIYFESDTGILQLKPIPTETPKADEALFKNDLNGFAAASLAFDQGKRQGQIAFVTTLFETGFQIPLNPQRLIDKVISKTDAFQAIIGGGNPGGGGGRIGIIDSQQEPRTIARRVRETSVVYLRGHAIRAGFPIQPPSLSTVGGVKAIAKSRIDRGEGFTTGIRTQGTTVLHYASWNLRYVLDGVPDRAKVQPPVIPGQPA